MLNISVKQSILNIGILLFILLPNHKFNKLYASEIGTIQNEISETNKNKAYLEYHYNNENYKAAITFGNLLVESGSLGDYDSYLLGMSYFYNEDMKYSILYLSKSIKDITKYDEWWRYGERAILIEGVVGDDSDDYFMMSDGGVSLVHKYSHAVVFRAIAKFRSEDYYGAISDFTKCPEIFEVWELPLEYLAISYYMTDQTELAFKYINIALEMYPDFVSGYIIRGDIYYNRGDTKNACLDWSEATNYGSQIGTDRIEEYCK